MINITPEPIVKSKMLIRKPVSEVFEALINPEITSKFWFTKGSGRLEPGKKIEWEWGQFAIKDTITVLDVTQNEFISFQWLLNNFVTTVEIRFEATSESNTIVNVAEKGFWDHPPVENEQLEEKIKIMTVQSGGWALVLSSMKAWLEYKMDLNLIADHHPTS